MENMCEACKESIGYTLRSKMVFADGKGYYSTKLTWNAKLTIARFRIKANTYKEYFDAVLGLIAEVDRKWEK